jgi:hypothetical protein
MIRAMRKKCSLVAQRGPEASGPCRRIPLNRPNSGPDISCVLCVPSCATSENWYKTSTFLVQKGGRGRTTFRSGAFALILGPLLSCFPASWIRGSISQNRQNRRTRRFPTDSTTLYQALTTNQNRRAPIFGASTLKSLWCLAFGVWCLAVALAPSWVDTTALLLNPLPTIRL